VVRDSAAHCNAVSFPPIVVAYGCFVYVDCMCLFLVLFGLFVAGVLNILAGAGVLLFVGRSS
jgi:hypothetical protein